MNDISSSTNFLNNTFVVDEIDIDTKRPHIDNHIDMFVRQIKVKETRVNQNESEKLKNKSNWKSPTGNVMRIKQRVLTPFHHNLSKSSHRNFANLDLSTIVSPCEARTIPEIIVTEFLDENNNEINDKENCFVNDSYSFKGNSQNFQFYKDVISTGQKTDSKSQKSSVNIKPIECRSGKCECCNKSIMKLNENRLFVSNSVNANLAVVDFENDQEESCNDSLHYFDTREGSREIKNDIFTDVPDSYDNDYYLMNEFLSQGQKNAQIPTQVISNIQNENFYFYCSPDKYSEINKKRQIKLETMIIDGELKSAVTLLTIPPDSSDITILNELFEKNTPIDINRIKCYIMIKRKSLEQHLKHLVKINDNKYLFKRSIILQGQFPRNWLTPK